MKRLILILSVAVSLSVACSAAGLIQSGAGRSQEEEPARSEQRCGDGVCDGPENQENCPADCVGAENESEGNASQAGSGLATSSGTLLFHIVENYVSTYDFGGTDCHSFTLARYLDGGYVTVSGREHDVLELEGYPTHQVVSKAAESFFYISAPVDPVQQIQGMSLLDWDTQGQSLHEGAMNGSRDEEIVMPQGSIFPGGAAAASGNEILVYLMTDPIEPGPEEMISGSFNPFISDSSLYLLDPDGGSPVEVLSRRTNRRLFAGMSDFSNDGGYFYTMARDGEDFQFVRINLDTGAVENLEDLYPGFNWAGINWDEFFPPANDFAYASFTMSPDETRLAAYKNVFLADMDDRCITAAEHRMWVFDLEAGVLDELQPRTGYISGTSWNPDGSMLAAAVLGNSGCYPDYMDAEIQVLDHDGVFQRVLVREPKSKITNVIWSPAGDSMAYDVYSMDFIGRLRLVDVDSGSVVELLNTGELDIEVDRMHPVVLMLADWMD